MICLPKLRLATWLLVVVLAAWPTAAQAQDPGSAAAIALLKDAAKPQRDGSHNALLLGLRELEDPALLPLFSGLSGSPYLSMRIHGQLGAAALSPTRRIDLASLAEIEEQREVAQVISSAIDDDLVDQKAMATLLTWEGLDLPIRQAIALRLVGMGQKVAVEPYEESLEIKLDADVTASRLLQYAIAAVIMAEQGDARGLASLNVLAQSKSENYLAVLAQVFDAAMRYEFKSIGALAISVATDDTREPALRLLAVQCAMRLGTHGAAQFWQTMFRNEESSSQRIRLAMIALDSAAKHEPALFDSLANQGEWIGHIGKAGRAIAGKDDDLAKAFEPLIETGQPLSVQWVVTYCQRDEPAQSAALLELIMLNHDKAPKHHRGKIIQTAIAATTALCELQSNWANDRLAQLLDVNRARPTGIDDDKHLVRRQIMLMGIARAQGVDLKPLAQSLEQDGLNDFTTESLRLFVRARHGAELTDKQWDTVSDIVQGVGQFDQAMRLQLGWAYLKQKGAQADAIKQALR